MSAAVGKARKAPTGPARAPPASRRGKRQPTTEIHRLGADPGAEPCVLDHLVTRLPSPHADGGTFGDGVLYEAEFDRPGVFASEIGATTVPLAQLNEERNEERPAIDDPDCT